MYMFIKKCLQVNWLLISSFFYYTEYGFSFLLFLYWIQFYFTINFFSAHRHYLYLSSKTFPSQSLVNLCYIHIPTRQKCRLRLNLEIALMKHFSALKMIITQMQVKICVIIKPTSVVKKYDNRRISLKFCESCWILIFFFLVTYSVSSLLQLDTCSRMKRLGRFWLAVLSALRLVIFVF